MLLRRALLALIFMVSAATAQPIERCHDATYAILDPNLGVDGNFVEVWRCTVPPEYDGCLFWSPANLSAAAFGEPAGTDPRNCWSRTEYTMTLTYNCPTDLLVELRGFFDSAIAVYDNETNASSVYIHTAKDDEGSTVDLTNTRTAAAVVSNYPSAVEQNGFSLALIADVIPIDSGDSIGFQPVMVGDFDVGFDIDMHNILIEVRQLDPPCYR